MWLGQWGWGSGGGWGGECLSWQWSCGMDGIEMYNSDSIIVEDRSV